MSQSVKEIARNHYPHFWDIDRLVKLVLSGKLTEVEYEEITGDTFTKTSGDSQ